MSNDNITKEWFDENSSMSISRKDLREILAKHKEDIIEDIKHELGIVLENTGFETLGLTAKLRYGREVLDEDNA